MIRAWVKVAPDSGEVMGYSERSIKWDDNDKAIPIPEVSEEGYLQIEVEPGNVNATFAADLASMMVTVTASASIDDPSDHNDPARLAEIEVRKASAKALIDGRGVPLNPVRTRPAP